MSVYREEGAPSGSVHCPADRDEQPTLRVCGTVLTVSQWFHPYELRPLAYVDEVSHPDEGLPEAASQMCTADQLRLAYTHVRAT